MRIHAHHTSGLGTLISNGTSAFRFRTTNTSSLFAGTSNAMRCALGWSIERNDGEFSLGLATSTCVEATAAFALADRQTCWMGAAQRCEAFLKAAL